MQQLTADVTKRNDLYTNAHILQCLYNSLEITITGQEIDGIKMLALQQHIYCHIEISIRFSDALSIFIFKPSDRLGDHFKSITANDTEEAVGSVFILIIGAHPGFINRHI